MKQLLQTGKQCIQYSYSIMTVYFALLTTILYYLFSYYILRTISISKMITQDKDNLEHYLRAFVINNENI